MLSSYLVKFVKLREDAVEPTYGSEQAAGFDLSVLEALSLSPGETRLVTFGIAVELIPGWEIQIRSRSGMTLRQQVIVLNSPGTVDSDYRGELGAILYNAGKEEQIIFKGDRVAQGVLCAVGRAVFKEVESDGLSSTQRGDKGYGSTGK